MNESIEDDLNDQLSSCGCKNKADLIYYETDPFRYNRWKVCCRSCGHGITNYGDPGSAIAAWNEKYRMK